MNAKQYLNETLGGNMNIEFLKPLAWHEIMEGYARHKLAEALNPSNNNYAKCADDILALDCADAVINKHGVLVTILKWYF